MSKYSIRQTNDTHHHSANPLRAITHGRAIICQTFYTYQHSFYKLTLSTTVHAQNKALRQMP